MRSDKGKNFQRGEGEIGAIIVIILLIWGGSYLYKYFTAPKNTTEIDKIYSEQRFNKEPYASFETISACSDNSGSCHSVVATIYHTFEKDGTEHKSVEQIDFDNGGYLTFGGAPLPGSGTDQKGNGWSFSQ
ncbi:MAG: hypothetical protein KGJ58_00280 [Patescibacteria group bacterium]|nr:hypothetical protein [Patescibacteria group bacterium]MDE1988389.1 hypothetical protein [Patescibacteria group bacterium]MDE2217879.1 hypothetical protein [Patescibacteria group bacterium]